MTDEEERALREQLARLLQEHRDLDAAISALVTSPGSDLIQIQRLKKRKLILRDKIRRIEDQLTPDIIAYAFSPSSCCSDSRPTAGRVFGPFAHTLRGPRPCWPPRVWHRRGAARHRRWRRPARAPARASR